MGGYDIYCYVCGIPVCDFKTKLPKKIHCSISPKLIEELRLGYFRTADGVIHNVKDIDTAGYFEYIDTDTNTKKDVHELVEKTNYNFTNCVCHRNCSKYLHPIKEHAIQKMFYKHKIHQQYFNAVVYVENILPVQIIDKRLLNNTCHKSTKSKSKEPSETKDKKNDPNYILNPATKRWVKKTGKVGRTLMKAL
jgi:hypothetical protein